MKLCDNDIEIALSKGLIKIYPMPSVNNINGATIDLHLGNNFRVFKNYTVPFIDLSKSKDNIRNIIDSIMSKQIYKSEHEKFFLHPEELALGITAEHITLPDNMIGLLDGRSSLARLGLIVHVTSNRIDPGWKGKIVLEFYNLGKLPLAMKPGMLIGALIIEKLSNTAIRPYSKRKNAKYLLQNEIIVSRIDKDEI